MYKSLDVAGRLREVAKLRGVTMKAVLEDCELNFNMMTMMRTSMPKADTLAKLADRLECSVDYLLGRTTEMLTPGSGQAQVPKNTTEMLSLFSQLPAQEQDRLIGRLQLMVEQLQAREEGPGGGSGSSPAKAV